MIADGKKCPFGTVHLSADRAHGGNAGSAQQVENQELIAGKGVEALAYIAVKHAENADDLLFSNKS